MGRSKTNSRARQRQEMLRELAADETISFVVGGCSSRAVEAVEALQRMRDGTYGTCVDCGGRIPAARLQVKPEATRCIGCQTEYEERGSPGADPVNEVRRTA